MMLLLGSVAGVSAQAIAVPTAWLRADSSQLNNTVWQDVSGHNHNAVSSTGTMPSQYALLNFNKCFHLQNGDYFQLSLDSLLSSCANVIIVYETADSAADNGLWSLQVDSATRVGLTTQRILNATGQIVFDSLNRLQKVVNYLSQSWSCAGARPCIATFGAADSLPLNGKIAEYIFFDHQISDTAITQWISYTALKYGITLYQTNYLNSQKQCIWNYDTCPDFSHTIVGLGRDSTFGLYQKQTCLSAQDALFGIDSLFADNELNTAQIAEGNFIVIGLDSNGLTVPADLYLSNGSWQQICANGRVQVTGNQASQYNTFLRLKADLWDTAGLLPTLWIDRSGTGEYALGDVELYYPTPTDSNTIWNFNRIHWDTDGNGTDAFCLVFPEDSTARNALAGGKPASESNPQTEAQPSESISPQAPLSSDTPRYRLYPNPTTGDYTLEILNVTPDEMTVTVHSADGKLVKLFSPKGKTGYTLHDHLSVPGTYLLSVNGHTFKLIVQ